LIKICLIRASSPIRTAGILLSTVTKKSMGLSIIRIRITLITSFIFHVPGLNPPPLGGTDAAVTIALRLRRGGVLPLAKLPRENTARMPDFPAYS
jgi:hypothetical protein